jgi:pimeloyl-ACP methyl ester carboxylesterase
VSNKAKPFIATIRPDNLADLLERIDKTRWPDQPHGSDWSGGAATVYVRDLLDGWRTFDWSGYTGTLNRFPQFIARIGDQDVHFVHVRGEGTAPLPLILTHGWPGSYLEYSKIIPLLTDPAAHGGDGDDAFDVVVPSLPGFGFSPRTARPAMVNAEVSDLWHELMTGVLGYQRYGAHGSDLGAGVTARLGLRHPDPLAGIHFSALSFPTPRRPWTDAEQRYVTDVRRWDETEGAYSMLQSTKPQTLAHGLTDSPAGLAAWLVEKYRAWGDTGGEIESRFTREHLLSTLSLYWLTSTIASSLRPYYEYTHRGTPLPEGQPIQVPAGFALFDNEFVPPGSPPRELAERFFTVNRWAVMPRGGHFPATEEPELLAAELRSFFRPLRIRGTAPPER